MIRLIRALFLFPLYYRLFNPCNKDCIVKAMCTRLCEDKNKYIQLRHDLYLQYYNKTAWLKNRYGPVYSDNILNMVFEVMLYVFHDIALVGLIVVAIVVILGIWGLQY